MRKKKSRLLIIDKDFVPAPMDDGDELYPNGIFMFNITKMIEYLKEHHDEIAPEIISVKASRNVFLKPNEDHINTTDITIPIILAEISPDRYNVIDGNHRLEKAYRSNIESILAYKLSPGQHMPFLTSVKAYHAYIDYWNSKIKDLMRYTKLKEKREHELLQQ